MSIGKDKAEKWNSYIYFCLLEVIINKSYVRKQEARTMGHVWRSQAVALMSDCTEV